MTTATARRCPACPQMCLGSITLRRHILDAHPTIRICARCHKAKPADQFAVDRSDLTGRYRYCRECHTEYRRQGGYDRAYHRALARLRDIHPRQFRRLLDEERAAQVGEGS